jgi:hypothetical protein
MEFALCVFLSFRPFPSGVESAFAVNFFTARTALKNAVPANRTSSKFLSSTPCYELAPFGGLPLRESSICSKQRFLRRMFSDGKITLGESKARPSEPYVFGTTGDSRWGCASTRSTPALTGWGWSGTNDGSTSVPLQETDGGFQSARCSAPLPTRQAKALRRLPGTGPQTGKPAVQSKMQVTKPMGWDALLDHRGSTAM